MSRKDPQFNLRIPAELRDKVMAAAQQNKRSATAEIISRLEATFDPDSFIDMTAGVKDAQSEEQVLRWELETIKKQFRLFQEMVELLRTPPSPEQLAWAEARLQEAREREK